jgi:hypothetical protein
VGTNEYTLWHLTPRGWKAGTVRLDTTPRKDRPVPTDTVATYRYIQRSGSEYVEGAYRESTSQITEEEERLLKHFGPCPERHAFRD